LPCTGAPQHVTPRSQQAQHAREAAETPRTPLRSDHATPACAARLHPCRTLDHAQSLGSTCQCCPGAKSPRVKAASLPSRLRPARAHHRPRAHAGHTTSVCLSVYLPACYCLASGAPPAARTGPHHVRPSVCLSGWLAAPLFLPPASPRGRRPPCKNGAATCATRRLERGQRVAQPRQMDVQQLDVVPHQRRAHPVERGALCGGTLRRHLLRAPPERRQRRLARRPRPVRLRLLRAWTHAAAVSCARRRPPKPLRRSIYAGRRGFCRTQPRSAARVGGCRSRCAGLSTRGAGASAARSRGAPPQPPPAKLAAAPSSPAVQAGRPHSPAKAAPGVARSEADRQTDRASLRAGRQQRAPHPGSLGSAEMGHQVQAGVRGGRAGRSGRRRRQALAQRVDAVQLLLEVDVPGHVAARGAWVVGEQLRRLRRQRRRQVVQSRLAAWGNEASTGSQHKERRCAEQNPIQRSKCPVVPNRTNCMLGPEPHCAPTGTHPCGRGFGGRPSSGASG
jgi:hypothetical protein